MKTYRLQDYIDQQITGIQLTCKACDERGLPQVQWWLNQPGVTEDTTEQEIEQRSKCPKCGSDDIAVDGLTEPDRNLAWNKHK